MLILAGDVGGTKTLLGLYDALGTKLYGRRFENAGRQGLLDLLQEFWADPRARGLGRPERAVFGVAGPVQDVGPGQQRARITNLAWDLDTTVLAEATGIGQVRLVNDFHAVAAAVSAWATEVETGLVPDSLVPLAPGVRPLPGGTIAVLGAGTGLGEAALIRSGGAPVILPTEGGHVDFAPRDDIEIELLRFLQRRHGGHVSYERVLSGAGLVALYEFFRDRGEPTEAAAVRAEIEADPAQGPAVISRHGLAGSDPLCTTALDRFCRIYGAEAGNLALKFLARGGVYIAGGIAPQILPRLQDGSFLQSFLDKGRFRTLCSGIPVYVVVHPEAGLYGAAVFARGL